MSDRLQAQPPGTVQDPKRELLARLMAEEGLISGGATIPRRPGGVETPLSHAQELLWMLDQAMPGLAAYNSAPAWQLEGRLDLSALAEALRLLVVRHEALRTRFVVVNDRTVQQADAGLESRLELVDLRELAPSIRAAEAANRLRAIAGTPFDLAQGRLFRPVLVRLTDASAMLLLLTHHIVSDAWSYGVMVRELSQLYTAALQGAAMPTGEPPIQFGDFAAWERNELVGDRLKTRLQYWRAALHGAGSEPSVPTDRPRPTAPAFAGGRAEITLSAELLARLKVLAAAEGATLYMVLLAAYHALLARWSGQEDVVTGSAIAGRSRSETEGVIGYFSGALPLRSRVSGLEPFRHLIRQIRTTVLAALEHQDVPVEALVRELQDQGRSGDASLFQAVLTMQDSGGGVLELPGVEVTPVTIETGATKFELTLLPTERAGGLELPLLYRTDLFDHATALRFLGHLATILEAVASNPETRTADLPILTPRERQELTAWNDTATDLGTPTTMTALIQSAGARVPRQTAVVAGDEQLTWEELMTRGNRLAHRLQELGVGPDIPVGLCLDRSTNLLVALYGALAAGGAYLPLLPEHPPERLAQQIRESGATIVVTVSAYRSLVPSGITAVLLDTEAGALAARSALPPEHRAMPEHLAYVLFTSGSTGVPKGVGVTHANLVHYTRAIAAALELDLSGKDIPWHCASVSTLAADLGHTSVFTALASGGVLHLLTADLLTDAARFQRYTAAQPLDLLKITPSHLQALMGPEFRPECLPRRWLVLGGEPCPWGLVSRVRSTTRCRVLNHYGPTETTVGATTFEPGVRDVSGWACATVPIGSPLPNVTTHVLDPGGHLAPVGVPGELWIGGAGVSRGYLHRDELTAARFVTRDGTRLYRTGDRVRRLPTGDLEFLGRFDLQVKIRGHRVELGEIEAALARHPAVGQAVAALAGESLLAYVVETTPVTDAALTAYLAGVLPDYMIPTRWVRLDALPVNANGKVERKALSAPPAPSNPSTTEGAPRSDMERRLAGLWQEVLKRDGIGRQDNFFSLGGHSLLAIRLLGRIAKECGTKLSLRTLFEHPTIDALAGILAPQHRFEAPLAAIWAEILKRDSVDRDANFFALGGHSLLAIRLLGTVAKQFGVRLPLRSLFERPTIALLAPAIEAAGGKAGA